MDIRMARLRETTIELNGTKGHFFNFEKSDRHIIAYAVWYVSTNTGKQSLQLTIQHGEPEQLRKLLETYFKAKVFAEKFDLHMITHLFEQYAFNENLDIICD